MLLWPQKGDDDDAGAACCGCRWGTCHPVQRVCQLPQWEQQPRPTDTHTHPYPPWRVHVFLSCSCFPPLQACFNAVCVLVKWGYAYPGRGPRGTRDCHCFPPAARRHRSPLQPLTVSVISMSTRVRSAGRRAKPPLRTIPSTGHGEVVAAPPPVTPLLAPAAPPDDTASKQTAAPQRTFSVAGLVLTSDFDSGNLGDVQFGGEADTDGVDTIDLFIAPDCHGEGRGNPGEAGCPKSQSATVVFIPCLPLPPPAGTKYENRYRLWYFFKVCGGTAGRTVRFRINNMNEIAKVYNQDLRPLVRLAGMSMWERYVPLVCVCVGLRL